MNKIDILPTAGHLLVELYEKPKESGGLIIPDSNQKNEAPVRGVVLRTSEKSENFNEGDVIFFRKYGIDELKFSLEDLTEEIVYLVDEGDVLGVIKKK